MNMFKMCLNFKVAAVLALVGVGILVLAPQLTAVALPLLILAICPLAMLVMGWAMLRGHGNSTQSPTAGTSRYACSMHSGVSTSQPGKCPECGMPLTPMPSDSREAALDGTPHEQQVARLRAQMEALRWQQLQIAEEIERLDTSADAPPRSRALDEAEEVARLTEGRQ